MTIQEQMVSRQRRWAALLWAVERRERTRKSDPHRSWQRAQAQKFPGAVGQLRQAAGRIARVTLVSP